MCAITGAAMNAAAARSSSISAATGGTRAEPRENPATDSADETEAPTPRPSGPDPARETASGDEEPEVVRGEPGDRVPHERALLAHVEPQPPDYPVLRGVP